MFVRVLRFKLGPSCASNKNPQRRSSPQTSQTCSLCEGPTVAANPLPPPPFPDLLSMARSAAEEVQLLDSIPRELLGRMLAASRELAARVR